jgi:hypothetical protein
MYSTIEKPHVKDPNVVINKARAYVKKNLVSCVHELYEMKKTGVLCDGFVRSATAEINKLPVDSAQNIVISLIEEQMLDAFIVAHTAWTPFNQKTDEI